MADLTKDEPKNEDKPQEYPATRIRKVTGLSRNDLNDLQKFLSAAMFRKEGKNILYTVDGVKQIAKILGLGYWDLLDSLRGRPAIWATVTDIPHNKRLLMAVYNEVEIKIKVNENKNFIKGMKVRVRDLKNGVGYLEGRHPRWKGKY